MDGRPILIDVRENGQDTADAIRENRPLRRRTNARQHDTQTMDACAHGQPTACTRRAFFTPVTRYTLHARHLSRSGNRTLDDIWSVTDQRGRARVTSTLLRGLKILNQNKLMIPVCNEGEEDCC